MIVLDTSVVVELLLNLPQVLRRRVAAGLTTAGQARTAVDTLEMMDVSYHDHQLSARRIWGLRDNLTAYDAAYVALAELLGARLVTSDARLARAPGHRADIDLIQPG